MEDALFQHGRTEMMITPQDRDTMDRALSILSRMATERTGWRGVILGRWYYSHEPLRNDAANLLREVNISFMMPVNTRLVGDE